MSEARHGMQERPREEDRHDRRREPNPSHAHCGRGREGGPHEADQLTAKATTTLLAIFPRVIRSLKRGCNRCCALSATASTRAR